MELTKGANTVVTSELEDRHFMVLKTPTEFWLIGDGKRVPADPLPAGAVVAKEQIVPGYDLVMRPIQGEKGILHA